MERNDLLDSLAYLAEVFKPMPRYIISPSAFHPKNKPVIGTFTSRAHPFVEWLAKWFPFDPNTYFENVQIGLTWADPIVIDSAALSIPMFGQEPKYGREYTVVCSHEQAKELTARFKKETP